MNFHADSGSSRYGSNARVRRGDGRDRIAVLERQKDSPPRSVKEERKDLLKIMKELQLMMKGAGHGNKDEDKKFRDRCKESHGYDAPQLLSLAKIYFRREVQADANAEDAHAQIRATQRQKIHETLLAIKPPV